MQKVSGGFQRDNIAFADMNQNLGEAKQSLEVFANLKLSLISKPDDHDRYPAIALNIDPILLPEYLQSCIGSGDSRVNSIMIGILGQPVYIGEHFLFKIFYLKLECTLS